jgi:hypothetical protein
MAGQDEEEWFDDAAGRLVRLYSLTGGRTRPRAQLDLATQVITARPDVDRTALEPEYIQIVDLCRRWLSVAEVAAYLKVPLVVVKVQLGDLIDRGDLVAGAPAQDAAPSSRELLQTVLDGLYAL